MNKLFCDRCKQEIKKGKEEEFKLIQLWTGSEDKQNDFWELCQTCSKSLLQFLKGEI